MGQPNDAAQAARVALGRTLTETFTVESKVDPALAGPITVGMPDGRDLLKIGLIQHQLREGVPLEQLDAWTQAVVMMLSTLAVVVRQAPPWWYQTPVDKDQKPIGPARPAPEQIKDMNLLWDIHERYAAFRRTFPGHGDDQEDGDTAAGTGAVAGRQNPGGQPVQ